MVKKQKSGSKSSTVVTNTPTTAAVTNAPMGYDEQRPKTQFVVFFSEICFVRGFFFFSMLCFKRLIISPPPTIFQPKESQQKTKMVGQFVDLIRQIPSHFRLTFGELAENVPPQVLYDMLTRNICK